MIQKCKKCKENQRTAISSFCRHWESSYNEGRGNLGTLILKATLKMMALGNLTTANWFHFDHYHSRRPAWFLLNATELRASTKLWQKWSKAKAWSYVAKGTEAENRNQTTGAVRRKAHQFSSKAKQLLESLLEWLRKSRHGRWTGSYSRQQWKWACLVLSFCTTQMCAWQFRYSCLFFITDVFFCFCFCFLFVNWVFPHAIFAR